MEKRVNIGGKLLNRNDLRKIKGGGATEPPDSPSGGGTGAAGTWKCCWTNTEICSRCVPCSNTCVCVTGASLVFCGL